MPSVKPLIRLSKAQMRRVIQRIMEKEGRLTPKAVSKIMRYEPPVEREVSTLRRIIPETPMPGAAPEEVMPMSRVETMRLPTEEARQMYMEAPEQFLKPTGAGPPMVRLRQVPPGSPEEFAAGIAYERIKEVPVLERPLPAIKSAPQTIAPAAQPVTPPAAPLAAEEALKARATELWQQIGGGRSAVGKLFKHYLNAQRAAIKKTFPTASDYFTHCYMRFKIDPKQFKRAYPREAKVLEHIAKTFED